MWCGYDCVVGWVEAKGYQLINIEAAANVAEKALAAKIGKVIAEELARTSAISNTKQLSSQ